MADQLKRRIGLGLLSVYGVGVMVGAGIYVLVGIVAGQAGIWAPVSFLLAGCVALPSALSYAELSARLPVAAGEAEYVAQGFRRPWLGRAVGLAIVLAGAVSAGAVLRGGVGYLTTIVPVDTVTATLALGAVLVAVAIIGAVESLAFAALFTLIEVGGLVLVIWAGFSAAPVADWVTPPPPHWGGIAAAVGLCFFAFIGFEDMVNMAEEVREPARVLPRGILLALAITAGLYALVSIAAVRSVPANVLAASEQPLALVWQAGRGGSAGFLAAIAVAAAINGVLAQIIMAARVLFGLGRGWRPLAALAVAHDRFGTPHRATLVVGGGVLAAALFLPVEELARITTTILLAVFVLINAALIALKRRQPAAPFRVPGWVPRAGLLTGLAALAANLWGLA